MKGILITILVSIIGSLFLFLLRDLIVHWIIDGKVLKEKSAPRIDYFMGYGGLEFKIKRLIAQILSSFNFGTIYLFYFFVITPTVSPFTSLPLYGFLAILLFVNCLVEALYNYGQFYTKMVPLRFRSIGAQNLDAVKIMDYFNKIKIPREYFYLEAVFQKRFDTSIKYVNSSPNDLTLYEKLKFMNGYLISTSQERGITLNKIQEMSMNERGNLNRELLKDDFFQKSQYNIALRVYAYFPSIMSVITSENPDPDVMKQVFGILEEIAEELCLKKINFLKEYKEIEKDIKKRNKEYIYEQLKADKEIYNKNKPLK